MKKSFTLIEVIISVFIFFVVVVSVMNIVNNNRHLISLLLENRDFSLKASLAFLNPDMKNNYYRAKKDFNISNSKVIDILRKDNILVDIKEDDVNFSKFRIIIKNLKAYDKFNSVSVYSVGIQ